MLGRMSLVLILLLGAPVVSWAESRVRFGTAKVEITPTRPLRLSGYSSRNRPFEGIAMPIWARCLAVEDRAGTKTAWVSVETLGITLEMRQRVLDRLADTGIDPKHLVLCATHTHTAPHVAGVADNIFSPRLEGAEADGARAFADFVVDRVVEAVRASLEQMEPGTLELGMTQATFAVNRRVLKDGSWVGFGVQEDGPVDHRVPVLAVRSNGKVRALLMNYACHATTLTDQLNQVHGDWPGIASARIESEHPGSVAVCMIGCGADANPNPRGTVELAEQHGEHLAQAVLTRLEQPMTPIDQPVTAAFGFAGLESDRPSKIELTARLASPNGHIRQHAENMLDILTRKDRIPETYPAPIQVIQFGKQLTMIALGGEVVVDYALRLTRELKDSIPAESLWITAYANDVYAYLASERMRAEKGYEFLESMYFYNQPGPWAEGTEDVVIGRVHDLLRNPEGEGNLSPDAALRSIDVAEGMTVELVAAEPLVADPVNIAFGPDGKLWVAEMGDYPLGEDNKGGTGGRVRYLEDTDGDGEFDKSTLFLDGLHFATGVHPWRKGVVVSAPPEVFYAEIDPDTGKVGKRETLIDGFAVGNPQHVINGFTIGIDNWLSMNGDETGTVQSRRTGQKVNMNGRDGRYRLATGELELECGVTQHVRSRDDWGNGFGGANYCPFWHYVLDHQTIVRNPYLVTPRPWQDLYGGYYPQVFPTSRVVDRFNDLFTAGRFTSACSPSPYRDVLLGADSAQTIFCCEPVHNLVHRARFLPDGLTFRAERFSADESSEFFASRDPWSRPVRVLTGPDGAVWIVDMYRQVIEHPEWIPEAWLARLDVRSGSDKGRIYRVFPTDRRPGAAAGFRIEDPSPSQWTKLLGHANGWHRDTAQQALVEAGDDDHTVSVLTEMAQTSENPLARLHAMGTLEGLGRLTPALLKSLYDHDHPGIRRWAIRFSEPMLERDDDLVRAAIEKADDPDITVRYQLACSLGSCPNPEAAVALAKIAAKDHADPWMRVAVLSASVHHPESILQSLLAANPEGSLDPKWIDGLLATAIGVHRDAGTVRVLATILPDDAEPAAWQFDAVRTIADALARRNSSMARWADEQSKSPTSEGALCVHRLRTVFDRARQIAVDDRLSVADRVRGTRLLGRGFDGTSEDLGRLHSLIEPNVPVEVQLAALQTIAERNENKSLPALLDDWRRLSPRLRDELVGLLATRAEWVEALVQSIEQGRIPAGEIPTGRQRELATFTHEALADRAKKLFEADRSARGDVLADHQSVLTMTGDASRGIAIFRKTCAHCHRFGPEGQLVGPDLGAVRDRSPTALLTAVLDPNRAVEARYLGYSAQLVDGRVLSGMIVTESSGSLLLARPDGKQEEILRVDVEELVSSGKSFMPEGLEKDLSAQDLADLFTYLAQEPERPSAP